MLGCHFVIWKSPCEGKTLSHDPLLKLEWLIAHPAAGGSSARGESVFGLFLALFGAILGLFLVVGATYVTDHSFATVIFIV